MKKYLVLIMICICCAFMVAGCSKNENSKQSVDKNNISSSDNNESVTEDGETNKTGNSENQDNKESTLSSSNNQNLSENVSSNTDEIDLTKLSSTMVYAEVYNMMTKPESYMGKTVKVKGQFAVAYDDNTKNNYFYVIVADATACCKQGIEFIWNGEHSYPSDYPSEQTVIEISGVFDSYEELGKTYYYLAIDDIVY